MMPSSSAVPKESDSKKDEYHGWRLLASPEEEKYEKDEIKARLVQISTT